MASKTIGQIDEVASLAANDLIEIERAGVSYSVELLNDDGAIPVNGIKFPSTQAPSTDANTLDDYEENTFTPGFAFGGASVGMAYSNQTGRYTKIGNRVFISGVITLSDKGSSIGAATITGLPFTSITDAAHFAVLNFRVSSVVFNDYPYGYIGSATNVVTLGETTHAGAVAGTTQADFASTSSIMFSGHYVSE